VRHDSPDLETPVLAKRMSAEQFAQPLESIWETKTDEERQAAQDLPATRNEPARVPTNKGCWWEPGSTPRDCLTVNHQILLRNLQGEERQTVVRRMQKSRDLCHSKKILGLEHGIETEKNEALWPRYGDYLSSDCNVDTCPIAESGGKSVRALHRSSLHQNRIIDSSEKSVRDLRQTFRVQTLEARVCGSCGAVVCPKM